MASPNLVPPLAIGLFGDWGAGKSFLMRDVRTRVDRLAQLAQDQSPPGASSQPTITHIQFNAWEYIQGDLWSALLEKVFTALDTSRLMVRPKADQVSYYKGTAWSDRLPRLVQTRMIETFQNSGAVKSVSPSSGQYALQTELRAFNIDVTSGRAAAEIDVFAKLVNTNTGKVVASKGFSSRVPAEAPATADPLSLIVAGAGEAPPTRALAEAIRRPPAPRPSARTVRPLKLRRTRVSGERVPRSSETTSPSRRIRTSPTPSLLLTWTRITVPCRWAERMRTTGF